MSDETTEHTVDDSDREPLTGKAWNPSAPFMPSENAGDGTIRRRVREAGNRAFAIIEPITLIVNALAGESQCATDKRLKPIRNTD